MKRLLGLVILAGLLGASPPPAAGKRLIHFSGPHPVRPGLLKGMCHIPGPHVHAYRPHRHVVLYVKKGPHWIFVGDPTVFENDVPKHAYYGHHPIFWVTGAPHAYCWIDGPHRHWHAPVPFSGFKIKGGVRWWVRPHPKWYKKQSWKRKRVSHYYAHVRVPRPVVTGGPPPGFVGVWIKPGGLRVKVGAPRVKVKVFGFGPGKHQHGWKLKHKGPGGKVEYKVKYKGPHGKLEYKYKYKAKGGKVKIKGKWKER